MRFVGSQLDQGDAAVTTAPEKDTPILDANTTMGAIELKAIAAYRADYPSAPPWQELDVSTRGIWIDHIAKQEVKP